MPADINHRDNLARQLLLKTMGLGEKIAGSRGRKITLMEVCGTHTMAFARSGLTRYLAGVLDLRSGPGCPVCVTHQQDLDYILALAELKEVITVTFGDLLRVRGSVSSLEQARARGARVEICCSPVEALSLAQRHPRREIILLGIGFETTAPAMASTVLQAKSMRLDNFSIFTTLKLVPPALHALLREQTFKLDGLILPGHVSAVLGRSAFDFLSRQYALPAVVTGFTDLDLLAGLYQLLSLIERREPATQNAYTHVVREDGNSTAKALLARCFEPEDVLWRGLGLIPQSGYRLKDDYHSFEARERFGLDSPRNETLADCRCGEIICGRATPFDCPLFNRACTPAKPVGPCMVSSEGACSAYYQHLLEDHTGPR